jgi:hypothetical protein
MNTHNLCPYCLTNTRYRQGLHSHIMQTRCCREKMEAQASEPLVASYKSPELGSTLDKNLDMRPNSPSLVYAGETEDDSMYLDPTFRPQ